MSKTFNPVIETDRQFKVMQSSDARAHLQLAIMDDFNGSKYVSFNNSHAPSLALAILEAAGYQEHSKAELGSSELLASYGMTKLRQAVQAQDREESEAEAQAKLEAEALEFLHVAQKHNNIPLTESWDGFMDGGTKLLYVNMARRAREINKEDNNA